MIVSVYYNFLVIQARTDQPGLFSERKLFLSHFSRWSLLTLAEMVVVIAAPISHHGRRIKVKMPGWNYNPRVSPSFTRCSHPERDRRGCGEGGRGREMMTGREGGGRERERDDDRERERVAGGGGRGGRREGEGTSER